MKENKKIQTPPAKEPNKKHKIILPPKKMIREGKDASKLPTSKKR